jgi:hypothetical protein
MSIKNIIQRYADIRLNERKMVGTLFLQSLLLGFSTSYYFVAANSFFIKKANVQDIPYAYIIAGACGFVLVHLFKWILKSKGSISGFIQVLILFALACSILYVGHLKLESNATISLYLAYAGFILIFPFANLFVLGFSGIYLQLFNLSQSKRLLALIGIGEVIASIIGYLTVPLLTKLVGGPVHLFLLAGVFIAASAIPVLSIYAANKEKFITKASAAAPRKFTLALFKKETFYLYLAIVTFFSVLAIYFTDYTYLVSVRSLSSLSGLALPDIVAIVFCIIKTGELLFSFFSANIISSRGMRFSLLLLPCLLLLLSALAVLAHFMFDDVLFFVIAFFLMAKWCDRVIRKGVYAPSTKVLYQVTAPEERMQLQTSIEGTISQISIILSGIILLLVSKFQKGARQEDFFKVMSYICLVFAGLWLAFAFGLYAGYKKRIHEYLHSIKQVGNNVQQHSIQATFTHWLMQQKDSITQKELEQVEQVFLENMHQADELTEQALLAKIETYNPSLGNVQEMDEASLKRRVIRFYFSNDNFFSRLLIIEYLEKTKALAQLTTIMELYEAGDLSTKRQIIAALNRLHYTPTEQERFYFTELCNQYVAEIAWVEPAIADLASIPNTNINDLLEQHAANCRNHILELLKILYGNETVHVVQLVLNETNKGAESRIFAVELLDNILEPSLKEIIIPVFEPIPQQMRWSKLSQHFLIYHVSPTDRLKEIVARNFKLMDVHIKQVALQCYQQLTNDETLLHACSSSLLEELFAKANQLQHKQAQTHPYFIKEQLASKLQLDQLFTQQQLSHLLRYGMLAEAHHKTASQLQQGFAKKTFGHMVALTQEHHKKVDIDVLGLAMMFKLKQAEML